MQTHLRLSAVLLGVSLVALCIHPDGGPGPPATATESEDESGRI